MTSSRFALAHTRCAMALAAIVTLAAAVPAIAEPHPPVAPATRSPAPAASPSPTAVAAADPPAPGSPGSADQPPALVTTEPAASAPAWVADRLDVAVHGGPTMFGPSVGGEIAWRFDRSRLGLALAARHGKWFPRGVPVEGVTTIDAQAMFGRTVRGDGPVSLELGAAAGLRRLGGIDDPRTGVSGELSVDAVVHARPGVRVRAGLALPIAVIGGEIDRLDQRLRWGADVEVARDAWLTADVHAGGAYGYDGDGAKFDAGVDLGVRLARLGGRRGSAARRGSVGAFFASEWRALGVADHASHGPGYAVGVSLFGDHLHVGLAGFNRPGPINPKTFATQPVDDQTWNGKRTLKLRSDGNFFGLQVAPCLDLGDLHLELPVTFGQAAFGFYLAGTDRDAVTGERVSAVENRLLDGRDSSFALGVELGVTMGYRATRWFAPYVSLHYLATIGYDAFVRGDYAGPSAAAGVQILL